MTEPARPTDSTPPAGLGAPDTVTEALAALEAEGYSSSVEIRDGLVRCGDCGERHPAEGVLVERIFRFEGMSNPDDEAIVMGVRCPHCDMAGALVSGYGPSADPEVLDVLTILARPRPA